MIRRPPRSTQSRSSAASDVYKRQVGTSIIKWVFGGTLELSDSVGCRYVTADVKRESTGFYEKLDFKHLLSEKEEEKRSYLPVYFDLIVLKKSKGS